MKTIRTMCLLLALLLICGCAKTSAPVQTEPADAPVSVTDMMGREATFDGRVGRIVVLSASDAEILYAVGAEDAIVGRGEYCDYPAEILDIPVASSGAETNVEQILALTPDAVVMTKMSQTVEQVEQLEAAGIPVIITDAQDIEGVYTAIELLSTLTGHADAGDALIESMREGFAALQRASTGKTVYFEVSPLEWGLWTTGAGTFMNEIAELIGLENAFSDVTDWAEVSEEQVLLRNPDYIVTVTMYTGEGPTPEEEILARAGWQDVAAVRNGTVFLADSDSMTRPGPRLLEAAQALSAFVYGAAESAA